MSTASMGSPTSRVGTLDVPRKLSEAALECNARADFDSPIRFKASGPSKGVQAVSLFDKVFVK
jgi:hypothetical protein